MKLVFSCILSLPLVIWCLSHLDLLSQTLIITREAVGLLFFLNVGQKEKGLLLSSRTEMVDRPNIWETRSIGNESDISSVPPSDNRRAPRRKGKGLETMTEPTYWTVERGIESSASSSRPSCWRHRFKLNHHLFLPELVLRLIKLRQGVHIPEQDIRVPSSVKSRFCIKSFLSMVTACT